METTTKLALAALGIAVYLATRPASAARAPSPPPPPEPSSGPPAPPALPGGDILQTVGKHWVLVNQLTTSKAANYGWHFKGATFGGTSFEASVSLPGVRVIQGVGTAHNALHTDYSQTCVLAAQGCTWKGQPARLSDLLQDPEASKLISHQGPLTVLRQPGVEPVPARTVTASDHITREQVAALPDGIAREPQVLAWIAAGYGEFEWIELTAGDLVFYVFADALQLGGVRVNVSATLGQQIADVLDATLLTPRMADLVFAASTRVISPIPQPAGPQMASGAYMLSESDKISAAAAKLAS